MSFVICTFSAASWRAVRKSLDFGLGIRGIRGMPGMVDFGFFVSLYSM
jgi:hypothetical protein